MNEFYDSLTESDRACSSRVALEYGRALRPRYQPLLNAKAASTDPYYVGLSSALGSFTHVSKRVALVTGTMLLSDHGVGEVHELGQVTEAYGGSLSTHDIDFRPAPAHATTRYGMVTENLAELGQWLLNAEPLMRRGLVWYGPVFAEGEPGVSDVDAGHASRTDPGPPTVIDRSIDFLVENGRAVDLSRDKPFASKVVRPVLEIDLPFIDSLSLSDFAQVTSDEFDSYRQFRTFLRSRLFELDDALETVDSQVALERVALSIRDEMEAATAEMNRAARSQALTRSGAVLSTTSAVLAAVRPDALQGALAVGSTVAAGAAGLWPTIQAFADGRAKGAPGKWHYVWVLQKRSSR
ncbi:hypothetical protein ACFQ0X_43425 [Streptomyces rectiviolaceus]|uniref:Uncharacterized protein n=1 Tax=Streptomyces rectiviolaceus TaxID=332591 RepID=A0ABP6NPR7_9ACTN